MLRILSKIKFFKETGNIKKELKLISEKLSLLSTYIYTKEIAPFVFDDFKYKLDDIYNNNIECLRTGWYLTNKNIEKLRSELVDEILKLHLVSGFRENNMDNEEQKKVYYSLIDKNTLSTPNVYSSFVDYLFMRGEITEELEALFYKIEGESDCWKRIPGRVWIRYMSFCLLTGNRQKAELLLGRYVTAHGLAGLETILPVAALALAHGHGNDKIRRATGLYRHFEPADETNVRLVEMLTKDTLCIVGNGPQEKGSGNGKIIDAHDVVIRCTGFNTSDEFADDYGRKTDIWVINGSNLVHEGLKSIKILIYIHDIYANVIKDMHYSAFFKYINNGIPIVYLTLQQKFEIEQKYGIKVPTTGFRALYLIRKIRKNFTDNNCFGFSFKNDHSNYAPNEIPYYFKKNMKTTERSSCDLAKESEVLRASFFENGMKHMEKVIQ